MLLPLIAFVMGCVVFGGIGLIVLSRGIPELRLTSVNLLLFVVGAFLGTLALELLYARIFADAGGHLRNSVAVIGQVPAMLVGAVGGRCRCGLVENSHSPERVAEVIRTSRRLQALRSKSPIFHVRYVKLAKLFPHFTCDSQDLTCTRRRRMGRYSGGPLRDGCYNNRGTTLSISKLS